MVENSAYSRNEVTHDSRKCLNCYICKISQMSQLRYFLLPLPVCRKCGRKLWLNPGNDSLPGGSRLAAASVECRRGLRRGPSFRPTLGTGLDWRGQKQAIWRTLVIGEACARLEDVFTVVMDASATPKLYKTLPGPLRKEEKKRSEDHHTHRWWYCCSPILTPTCSPLFGLNLNLSFSNMISSGMNFFDNFRKKTPSTPTPDTASTSSHRWVLFPSFSYFKRSLIRLEVIRIVQIK